MDLEELEAIRKWSKTDNPETNTNVLGHWWARKA
jgi:hypothetical protein